MKDRLFFFAGYQGTNTRVSCRPTTRANVPTAAMLAGDFTAFASPACNGGRQLTLRCPVCEQQDARTALSPAALAHLGEAARRRPIRADSCSYGLPFASDEGQTVGKVDYQLNNKHRVFGRYIATKQFTPPPFSLRRGAAEPACHAAAAAATTSRRRFTTGDDFVISPTTLNACASRSIARTSAARARTSSPRLKSASTSTATCRTTCC